MTIRTNHALAIVTALPEPAGRFAREASRRLVVSVPVVVATAVIYGSSAISWGRRARTRLSLQVPPGAPPREPGFQGRQPPRQPRPGRARPWRQDRQHRPLPGADYQPRS